jgi:hypothetical protein
VREAVSYVLGGAAAVFLLLGLLFLYLMLSWEDLWEE